MNKFRLVLTFRLALTLIGLVCILLAIKFLTNGMNQSGRIRVSTPVNHASRTPAALSASSIALPAAQENVKYGLLVGQYTVKSEAEAMAVRAGGTVFKVTDNTGQSWWATLVGPYNSVKDAHDHLDDVAARLTPAPRIPVVKWPQSSKER